MSQADSEEDIQNVKTSAKMSPNQEMVEKSDVYESDQKDEEMDESSD